MINQPAGSFIVSGGSFTLDSLTLSLFQSQQVIEEEDPQTLEISRFKTGIGDDYEIRLWDTQQDSSNRDIPGTLLETFSTSSTGVVTLNSTLNPLLADGLRYWVSAAIPEVSFPLSAGAWETVELASLGRAVSFSNAADVPFLFTVSTSALSLLVTGTAVPEPTAAVLMILGAGVWLGRRR